jgi:hypothetical protein
MKWADFQPPSARGREGQFGELEGVEHRLETGREGEGVGHPEYMLDPGWC